MARIRSIHPGLWTDEAFMSLTVHARLLIMGVWGEAWDDGVFEWKPLTLKARLFPVDNVDVAALLAELEAVNVVRRFESGRKTYGAVRNFRKYQRPKKPNSSGLLPSEFGTYVGLSDPSSEPDGGEDASVPPKSEKSPQMEDGGWRREGDDEKDDKLNHLASSAPEPEKPRPFPKDGSISFSPFADIVRKKTRGADPDVVAQAFRSFCFSNYIDFADARICKTFETFCARHKVSGVGAH